MRVLVVGAVALLVSVLVTYLFGEVWFALYMWRQGISNPADLSEDYGGAFFQLIAMTLAFIVCLISTSITTWRISERFIDADKP